MGKVEIEFLLRLIVCYLLVITNSVMAAEWPESLASFLETHCHSCHSGPEAESNLDLVQLGGDLSDADVTAKWTLVHDRIASGDMPPESEPRPDSAAMKIVLATLSKELTSSHLNRRDVVLRRLNRTEYENTVRDLFDTFVLVKDQLPEDTQTDGFDTVGEGLAVSAEAIGAYLQAADTVLDAAFGSAKAPESIQLTTNLVDQKDWRGNLLNESQFGKMFRKTPDGMVIFQSNYCPTAIREFRAPAAGTYRGTIRARAIQSETPVTLRIYGGDVIVGRREKHVVGYYDIPPNEWVTITFEDRLVESGGTYLPKCYGTFDTRKNADTFPGPGIELGEITLEGPLEEWPPLSRKKLLRAVDVRKATAVDAREVLSRFLPRALRRPVRDDEIETYHQLVVAAIQENRSFEEALRLGLKAVLCSPDFLFLEEPGRETIDDFSLASRLSYFLWSSTPDEELLALAGCGELGRPDVLRQQVERLLNDPRADRFTQNFTGQWLNLADIDFTSPDEKLYPEFDELLKLSMLQETRYFFDEVLGHDLPVLSFVDSEFTFLNERLSKHYGIEGVTGQEFRKVTLPKDSVRGGLLTQASVLKVTANGSNTSPVVRGVWVMDRILGERIPPPPSNVPAVEPDIRGATTLREQLAKHRDVESCAVCHRMIDPAGFALESFDVIGGWRERYRTMGEGERSNIMLNPYASVRTVYKWGLPVDASGITVHDQSFQDIREFKQLLCEDQSAIARSLTRRLLTYGLGRRLGFSDRPAIEKIVSESSQSNYGFRSLIHAIVQSELFRSP